MAWVLTTSGAAIVKAGANANSNVIASSGTLSQWNLEAEADICAITRYDWVTNYSALNSEFKNILNDVCSDLMAMKIITYDMSGYTSRFEAQTMLDVLRDNIQRNIEALKDQKNQEKII